MKAFRIISVALMAVLLAVCLGACSKMENDGPEKKLVKMYFANSSYNLTYTFNYDDKGLLKDASLETVFDESNPSTYINTYNYVWNSQTIDVIATTSSEGIILEQYEYTFHTSEGLVRSTTYSDGITPDISLGYDSSSRLIRFDKTVIDWNNDMMTSIKLDTEHLSYTILYTYGTTSPVKGYSPYIPFSMQGEALFMAHPELGGVKTSQIPETEIILPHDSNQQSRFEYEFDKDGYISKILGTTTQTNQESGEQESWENVYTFVWE